MAANENPIATPEWLERAAKTELPAAFDRVALTPPAKSAPSVLESVSSPKPAPARQEPRPPKAKADNESDVHRRAFDAAALLPSTVTLGLVTVGVVTLMKPFVPARFVTELVSLPLLALWTGQIIIAGYRLFAFRYRMTSRRLFRERGRLYPADEPLELAKIGRVEVRQTRLQSWLDVGDVVVLPEESSGRMPLEMIGVRWPEKLAHLIEETAAAMRAETVKSVRSAFPNAMRS